jgi:hypothetical protein
MSSISIHLAQNAYSGHKTAPSPLFGPRAASLLGVRPGLLVHVQALTWQTDRGFSPSTPLLPTPPNRPCRSVSTLSVSPASCLSGIS